MSLKGSRVVRVDGLGDLPGDVAVAHVAAHDAGVLALRQGLVVAVARAWHGLLDEQLLRQRNNTSAHASLPLSA